MKVVVPAVRNNVMIHCLIENLENLKPGNFGVPEPEAVHEATVNNIDAVIIPIVAFDGFGMRLGYGKGFYDRFLSTLPHNIERVGLAFSLQEVDSIPMFSHDQLMKNIFTEQTNFFFK